MPRSIYFLITKGIHRALDAGCDDSLALHFSSWFHRCLFSYFAPSFQLTKIISNASNLISLVSLLVLPPPSRCFKGFIAADLCCQNIWLGQLGLPSAGGKGRKKEGSHGIIFCSEPFHNGSCISAETTVEPLAATAVPKENNRGRRWSLPRLRILRQKVSCRGGPLFHG